MTGKEAIQTLQSWRDLAEFDGVSSLSMQEANPALDEALKIAIDAIKESEAFDKELRAKEEEAFLHEP